MPERSLEGIQITETPGAEQPIARASAHLTAFVGRTLRGPVERAPSHFESGTAPVDPGETTRRIALLRVGLVASPDGDLVTSAPRGLDIATQKVEALGR